MQIADAELKKLLIDSGQVKEDALKGVWKEDSKTSLQDAVLKNNLISEKDLTILLAGYVGVPFAELANLKVPRDILVKIPERTARKYQAVLFGVDGNNLLQLAMVDPEDFQAVDFIGKELGAKPLVYIGTPSDIGAILDQYRGGLSGEIADTVKSSPDEEKEPTTEELSAKDLGEDAPIAKTVNVILEYAVKSRASDVHIEPREDVVQVRYRIDGVLHETMTLPKNILPAVVSRIKILANLKIDEHRVPQDGRFKLTIGPRLVSLRVSTLPVMDGEKVVMRLLDESTKAPTLEELGFYGRALAAVGENLHKPHGMTLVTGPTGSGKSTTLYSILTLLNTPGVNISTVEDPVEYRIVGVNQTQVNTVTGMTFANGLRALLRQDPNIIMVGEIRDGETADLAIQAALTGHVVLSTLHTNNAATSLPRLLDMGAEPFLIASTVNTVIGQRLVRRLCPNCRVVFVPVAEEVTAIKRDFDVEGGLKHYQENQDQLQAQLKKDDDPTAGAKPAAGKSDPAAATATKPAAAAAPAPKPGQFTLYKAGPGCQTCGGASYQGRVGIYEVLNVSPAIQRMIVGRSTSSDIQDLAVKEGTLTMQQDGFVKALLGLTTIEEVLRVTRE